MCEWFPRIGSVVWAVWELRWGVRRGAELGRLISVLHLHLRHLHFRLHLPLNLNF